MTFREYVEINYPDLANSIDSYQNYSELYQILFPNYSQISHSLDDLNYEPFEYGNDPVSINYNGGHVVMDIAQYIGENYYENEINKRFVKVNASYSALRNKILMLMYRYKYKWHALWESMQLDSQYDPLDNVNEIYDETITRTPDLTYTDSNSNIFGQQTKNISDVHGAQKVENETVYGAQSVENETVYGAQHEENESYHDSQHVESENIYGAQTVTDTNAYGQRITNTETEIGGRMESDGSTNSTHPYDSPSNNYPTESSTATHSVGSQQNTEEVTIDSYTDTLTKALGTHTDTSETDSNSYTDRNEIDKNSYTDTTTTDSATHTDTITTDSASYTDTSQVVDSQHTDSFSGTKTETGEEETVVSRRRHGNIGVTTSGQLIADFRNTHYFDLIQIMSNDIVNEIVDLNFSS